MAKHASRAGGALLSLGIGRRRWNIGGFCTYWPLSQCIVEGLGGAGFCPSHIWGSLLQQQCPFESIHLGFPQVFARTPHHPQRLLQGPCFQDGFGHFFHEPRYTIGLLNDVLQPHGGQAFPPGNLLRQPGNLRSG